MDLKRIIAIVCSAILLPCLPAQAVQGYTPPQLYLAPAPQDAPAFLVTASGGVSETAQYVDLPAAYDMREAGLVTSVKDQNPYGTCWCFGSIASLESGLIAREPQIDLSEWYLAHRTFRSPSGYTSLSSSQEYLNAGGYMNRVISVLMNWVGPALEADYPYDGPEPDFTKTIDEVRQEGVCHVTDFHYFPRSSDGSMDDATRNQLKQAIYAGHAVYFEIGTSAFDRSDVYHEQNNTYYTPDDFWDTFDWDNDSPDNYMGHAMCIVGWDDTIPADSFATRPPQDGAWLVKNSWGTMFGDDGFFWISYADTFLDSFVCYDTESAASHDMLYGHDDFGCNGAFSVTSSYTDTKVYGANVFTAAADSYITDAMINCASIDDTCEITIYTGLQKETDPTSGTASAATSAKLTHLGYQTIALKEPVHVNKGEKFSVVVRFTGSKGPHLACEMGYLETGAVGGKGYSYELSVMENTYYPFDVLSKSFHQNESFFSTDGKKWNDTFKQGRTSTQYGDSIRVGNLCIKVMAVNDGTVHFSDDHAALPYGEELALSTPEPAEIWYAVNGGDYQKYTEPITFTGDMTISAYADTGERTVYTRHYTQQHAELSSLLYMDGYSGEYLALDGSAIVRDHRAEENAYLRPISTGQITINGEPCISGHKYELAVKDPEDTVTITVEQENMLPTTYELTIRNMCLQPITDGVWMGYEGGELYKSVAYDLHGGKGIRKDLDTGELSEFTYERTGDKAYTFTYPDRTEVYDYTLNSYGSGEYAGLDVYLEQNGESFGTLSLRSERTFAEYLCFCTAEIEAGVAAYYADLTGVTPDRIVYHNQTELVEVYVGDEVVKRYWADSNGSIWDENDSQQYFFAAATGDVSTDMTINASDAAQILIEAAVRGASTLGYAQRLAADVNHDSAVNATDAAIVLRYAAAVGAGDKTIRLADLTG